jgi:hypothetical protein
MATKPKARTTKRKSAKKKLTIKQVVKSLKPKEKVISHPGFNVIHRTNKVDVDEKFIQYVDGSLWRDVNEAIRNNMKNPVALADLAIKIGSLDAYSHGGCYSSEHFDSFVEYVKGEAAPILAAARTKLDSGRLSFDDLNLLFSTGAEVVHIDDDDGMQGGKVQSASIQQSFFGSRLQVQLKVISSESGQPDFAQRTVFVPYFEGEKSITDLPLRPLTPEVKVQLATRGLRFLEITQKPAYLDYSGTIIRKNWWSNQEYTAHGRVMVDAKMMRKQDAQYFTRFDRYRDDEQSLGNDRIGPELAWMAAPIVFGFSFSTKKWGEMKVEQMGAVQFDKTAFDTLVLDPTKKSMVHALVKNHGTGFQDIIKGKGGGTIFLLHGPPGTGKTLTAEAIAELLERPLYSVSVGELGTEPITLETRLREILEMATTWNAVVLLDEADIFLEARDEQNILRNSMVGVFLRLLEYHQGVLFLTTNRVRNFDRAFHSRVSVALQYEDLSPEARGSIWTNLLGVAGIGGLDVTKFSHIELNGRQIKNVIRMSQTLAKSQSRPVTADDIFTTVGVVEKFGHDLRA